MFRHIVFYDAKCLLYKRVKKIVGHLDWMNRIEWYPVQEIHQSLYSRVLDYRDVDEQIHMFTTQTELLSGFQTIRKILTILPVKKPLGYLFYLPFIESIVQPVYSYLSKHR
ncbi:DCC1-like thiol-disulfide oxidoreductase family protein [Bacillus sp. NPDC077027]|uniref:DCC1-like thiol-disulfide oxidoreductase family protein n=1 Tax=Bacillus sp. NPDC077027 TaxID=3390548 RepID=UPI003CFE8F5E